MRKRLYIVTMSDKRYEDNKEHLRKDIISIKPIEGLRKISVWLSPSEAFNARKELFWFNIGKTDKVTMKKGILTKEV